jgi:predicted transcriptional regulator
MKVNLSQIGSSDPRLGLDEGDDPCWWDTDSSATAGRLANHPGPGPGRTGYGHDCTLPPETVGTRQRESIEELFDAALAGFLPRSRDLKPWEPDKLNPRHLQVINLKAAGVSNKKIAEMLAISEPNVSVIVNHPDSQYILARIIAYAAENVVDVEARIKATAPLAHEKLVEILTTSPKQELVAKVAFGFLDRAGYGAVQKAEIKQSVSISVPKEEANLIRDAIREASQIQEADYVILGDTKALPGAPAGASREPSGNSLGHPGSPIVNGSEGGPTESFSVAEDSGTTSAGGSQDSTSKAKVA